MKIIKFLFNNIQIDRQKPLNAEQLGIIKENNSSAKYSIGLNEIWFGKNYNKIKDNALAKTVLRHLSSIYIK